MVHLPIAPIAHRCDIHFLLQAYMITRGRWLFSNSPGTCCKFVQCLELQPCRPVLCVPQRRSVLLKGGTL